MYSLKGCFKFNTLSLHLYPPGKQCNKSLEPDFLIYLVILHSSIKNLNFRTELAYNNNIIQQGNFR